LRFGRSQRDNRHREAGSGRRMSGIPDEVVLRIDAGPDADAEEVAELALRLRDDLRANDVASVELARDAEAPERAKAGGAVEWGTLLVGVVSSGALTAVLTTANSWVSRQRRGRVHVKIGEDELMLTGMPTDEQRRLIDHWIARRGPEADDV
jgi:Effector Associated Constant Component 1